MTARAQVRWRTQTRNHARDALAWLFDYNSLEMLSTASMILIFIFGIMLETYSLSHPILGHMQLNAGSLDEGFASAVDGAIIFLFVVPVVLLVSSLLLDVFRNTMYACHHRQLERQREDMARIRRSAEHQLERERAKSDTVQAWVRKRRQQLKAALLQLDESLRAKLKSLQENFEEDESELEDMLKEVLTERAKLEEVISRIRQHMPSTEGEAMKLSRDQERIGAAKRQLEEELLSLEDEMNALSRAHRERSSAIRVQIEKEKARLQSACEEDIERYMERMGPHMHGKGRNGLRKSTCRWPSKLPSWLRVRSLTIVCSA